MVKLGLKTTKTQENLAEIVEQPPGWTALLPISLRMRRKVIADEAAKRAEDRRQAILDQQEAPMRFRARSKVIFIIFSFSSRSFLDEHMLQSALPQPICGGKEASKARKTPGDGVSAHGARGEEGALSRLQARARWLARQEPGRASPVAAKACQNSINYYSI